MPIIPTQERRPGLDLLHSLMAGYTGPALGSPELAAARAAGQHPIADYLRSMRLANGPRNDRPPRPEPSHYGGIVPPMLGEPPHPVEMPQVPSYGNALAPLGGVDERRPGKPNPLVAQRQQRPVRQVMK